jgi:type I restriction enzyme, S subunit
VINGWKPAVLADALLDVKSGFACGEDPPDGVFQFRMNNISPDGTLDFRKKRRVPNNSRNFESFLLSPGDVLFNATNSPEMVGKSAYFPGHDEPATYSNHFLRLRPREDMLDGRFLARWLMIEFERGLFRSMCRQWVNQATVSREALLGLPLRLPPLPMQQRIVEVLDRAEALRAKRRSALAQLDTLVQTIFIEMFGDIVQNTRKLPTVTLGELGRWQSGGTPPRQRADYFDGDIPWFSSGELNEMYVHNSAEHISESALRETSAKLLERESLMLGMYDTAALKASITTVRCSCNQAIAFATINPSLAETTFVYWAITIGRKEFRRLQRGVRQKNLNLSMIREIRIPLPHIDLQREFTRRVAAIERMKVAQLTSLAELDALFASLQHRAFRGEL